MSTIVQVSVTNPSKTGRVIVKAVNPSHGKAECPSAARIEIGPGESEDFFAMDNQSLLVELVREG